MKEPAINKQFWGDGGWVRRLLAVALAMVVSAQAQVAVQFKDFSALGTDRAGKKSVIKGSDARQAPNGIIEVTQAHVEMFKADNSLELTIDAPQALYDNTAKTASSPSELAVKTADGRLELHGVGFSWRQSDSTLVVSNQVQATLQKGLLSTNILSPGLNPRPKASSTPLRVTSSRLEYAGDEVVFRGQVHAADDTSTLDCEVLRLKLGQGETRLSRVEAENNVVMQQGQTRATGGRASYDLSRESVRIEQNTAWQLGGRSGESAWLEIGLTNRAVLAGGGVHMVLPAAGFMQGLSTNDSTLKTSLEINAENFEYHESAIPPKDATAIFTGNVKAREPQGRVDSERLTIEFQGTNQLRRVIAEQNVEMIRGADRLTGKRAVYDVAADEITVTGDPTWQLQDKRGSSQTMTFHPRSRAIRAHDRVEVEIPTSGELTAQLLPAGTQRNTAKPSTATMALVSADSFHFDDNVGVFEGRVQVRDAKGSLDCGQLEIVTGASNRLSQLTARGNVILLQGAIAAIGQKAVYSATNQLVTLTGSPKILTATQQVTAEEFQMDRARGTFVARGPYRIQVAKNGMKGLPSLGPTFRGTAPTSVSAGP